ncbi:hypothetical protein CYMTET_42318, partial [Cymbomonas tetramitiformis]
MSRFSLITIALVDKERLGCTASQQNRHEAVAGYKMYLTLAGDTWGGVAEKLKVPVKHLLQWNKESADTTDQWVALEEGSWLLLEPREDEAEPLVPVAAMCGKEAPEVEVVLEGIRGSLREDLEGVRYLKLQGKQEVDLTALSKSKSQRGKCDWEDSFRKYEAGGSGACVAQWLRAQ